MITPRTIDSAATGMQGAMVNAERMSDELGAAVPDTGEVGKMYGLASEYVANVARFEHSPDALTTAVDGLSALNDAMVHTLSGEFDGALSAAGRAKTQLDRALQSEVAAAAARAF